MDEEEAMVASRNDREGRRVRRKVGWMGLRGWCNKGTRAVGGVHHLDSRCHNLHNLYAINVGRLLAAQGRDLGLLRRAPCGG